MEYIMLYREKIDNRQRYISIVFGILDGEKCYEEKKRTELRKSIKKMGF